MSDALALLIAERDRLNHAIQILSSRLPERRGRKPKSFSVGLDSLSAAPTGKRRGRKKMSAADRKAVSERMRKYWAARRKAKSK